LDPGKKNVVRPAEPRPPKEKGTIVVDEGDAAVKLADFLQEHKFI